MRQEMKKQSIRLHKNKFYWIAEQTGFQLVQGQNEVLEHFTGVDRLEAMKVSWSFSSEDSWVVRDGLLWIANRPLKHLLVTWSQAHQGSFTWMSGRNSLTNCLPWLTLCSDVSRHLIHQFTLSSIHFIKNSFHQQFTSEQKKAPNKTQTLKILLKIKIHSNRSKMCGHLFLNWQTKWLHYIS